MIASACCAASGVRWSATSRRGVAPYTSDWAEARGEETLAGAGFRHFDPIGIEMAEAGDVILFRWRTGLPAKHVGVLTSAQSMVHAQEGAAVCEVPLSVWWQRRIAFAFRFRGLCLPATFEV